MRKTNEGDLGEHDRGGPRGNYEHQTAAQGDVRRKKEPPDVPCGDTWLPQGLSEAQTDRGGIVDHLKHVGKTDSGDQLPSSDVRHAHCIDLCVYTGSSYKCGGTDGRGIKRMRTESEAAGVRGALGNSGEEHRGAAGGEAAEEERGGGDHVRPREQRSTERNLWRGRDELFDGDLTSGMATKVTVERLSDPNAIDGMRTAETEIEEPRQRPSQGLDSAQGCSMAQPRIAEAEVTTDFVQPGEDRLRSVVGHGIGDRVVVTDCIVAPSLRRRSYVDDHEAAEHDRAEFHDEVRERGERRGAGTDSDSSARRGGGRRVVRGSGGSAARCGARPPSSGRGG